MRVILISAVLLLSLSVHADGVMFNDSGRFPYKEVTVIELTKKQVELIDYYYACRSNKHNYETPYFFSLTENQEEILYKEARLSPEKYAIASSFNGDEGSEFKINVINRFSDDSIEIPHKLLTKDEIAKNWELDIIGWSTPSRYESLNIKNVLTSGCKSLNKASH